jgi:hypothetical protein
MHMGRSARTTSALNRAGSSNGTLCAELSNQIVSFAGALKASR